MKKKNKRLTALILCLALSLTAMAPAMALDIAAYSTVASARAAVYAGASTSSTVLGYLSAGAAVAIESQTSTGFYCIRTAGVNSTSVGYILKSDVSSDLTAAASGTVVAATAATAATTSAAMDEGQAGYITNCNSYVNFRSAASASSAKLGTLAKNSTLAVLGESSGFYQVLVDGETGYVAKEYVALGTPATTAASSAASEGGVSTAASASASSHVAAQMAAAKAINSDVVGYIYLPGTNIDFPILYSASQHYYSSRNINKQSDSKGSIYTYYNVLTRNNIITGHNMRTSGTMFHELHHIQEKTLGYSTCQVSKSSDCQRCGRVIASTVPSLTASANQVWEISLNGYTQWQVWAMYETPANEAANTLAYNTQHLSSSTASAINTWINYQKSRSEYDFNTSVSADDIFLTIYTCGTNYDSATAQSRLYFFLKAVG